MQRPATPSEQYRQQGNELFAKLKDQEHAAPVIRRGRFSDTLKCYNQALSASANDEQRASAYKNMGALFGYQATRDGTNEADLEYHVKECVTSYGRAHELGKLEYSVLAIIITSFVGKESKSNEWLASIRRQIEQFVYDLHACFCMLPPEERLQSLRFVANTFEGTTIGKLDSIATVYYSLAQFQFEKTISLGKEESQLIYDCRPCLDRALYWAHQSDEFRLQEVADLRDSIWLHQCIHESNKARRTGQQMLLTHLNNDEVLNMDMVWIVMDEFREAILLAREHDIEGKSVQNYCLEHHLF